MSFVNPNYIPYLHVSVLAISSLNSAWAMHWAAMQHGYIVSNFLQARANSKKLCQIVMKRSDEARAEFKEEMARIDACKYGSLRLPSSL